MRQDFRFLQWCQSRQGAVALLLVLATGTLVGYYGWLALLAPPPPTYYLDFDAAPWIQASEPGDNVCFRKNLYLSETPKYAWLQMAGLDGFTLSVNGKHASVGHNESEDESTVLSLTAGGNESVICDITHYLLPGKNAIAVNVTRGSFPGRSKLVCRGGIIDQSGRLTEFSSDKTWRVALAPGTIPALISWTDREMDDSRWAHAEQTTSERSGLTQPVTLPPILLQQPVKGKWITDERPGPAGDTAFLRHFDAPNGNTDAWLQIAANGNYSVVFNGHFLGNFNDPSPVIRFLHLKRWMKAWGNDLSVKVRGLDALPALIAEVSFVSGGAQADSIVSDHHWRLPTSRPATTIGSYNYAGDRWGFPPKMNVPVELSSVEATHQSMLGIVFMFLVAAAVFLGWTWSGGLPQKKNEWERARCFGIAAALHLPALVATAALLLLRYDIRFRPESPVKPEFFMGLIALLILPPLLVWARRRKPAPLFSASETRRDWASQNRFWIALGVIVLAALAMRLHGLTAFPLDQDDILIRNYAMGIFDRGYPSLNFYNYVIPITTYELLPYPIALSCFIFGWSDWAVLLPAVVFGTLTTLLLGLMGRSLFDWRTGLLAALIYAFNPFNVFWAQHCFHPSQDQFFAILTIWFFYLAIRQPGKLEPKYWYAACVCFCLLYLSWEGSGFLLPVLAGALLLMHPGRWVWLRQSQLWIGFIAVASVVLIEMSMRKMAVPSFLFLGYGLALLNPSPTVFLNPESMPSYYVSSILLTEPHLLLTIMCGVGSLFAWQNRPVRYCLVVLLGLLVFFSLFLPVYSVRYFYFYQFVLILLPCGVLFLLWDRIRELTSEWRTARLLAWGSGITAVLLVFGTATETGLKVFRLAEQTAQGRSRVEPSMRYGIVRQDTRRPAQFVASRLRPGDIVLANLTQAFYLYGQRMPDFGMNTLLATRMIYLNDYGTYRHRFVGIPMVRNMRDMHNVFDQGRRVWYLGGGSVTLQAQDVKDALDLVFQRSKIVYATYHAKVYLWDGTGTPAQQTVSYPALPPQPGMQAEKPDPEDRVVEEQSWAENGKTLLYPRVTKSNLYPEWTHQNVPEREPARVNAKLKVQPLQPPREPQKPQSDENAFE